MDILTSMLAYLGCITGLVGALAISFFMYFSAAASSANFPPSAAHGTAALSASAMTVRQTAPKVTTVAETQPATVAEHPLHAAAIAPPAAPRAPSSRQSALPSRADYFRRLVQQERAKRWAYQQDPDFESRFLGYAD